MDIQALLNAVASGPTPNVASGVTRVPIPKVSLGGIGQVAVPVVPGTPGGPPGPQAPVVPGQPLPGGPVAYNAVNPNAPYGTALGVKGPAAEVVDRAAGLGHIIGQAGPPSNYQPTALGTLQLAGPRGDRTLLANAGLGQGTGGPRGDRAAPQTNAQRQGQQQQPLQQPIHQQNMQLMNLVNQLNRPPASAARAPVPPRLVPAAAPPRPLGTLIAPRKPVVRNEPRRNA